MVDVTPPRRPRAVWHASHYGQNKENYDNILQNTLAPDYSVVAKEPGPCNLCRDKTHKKQVRRWWCKSHRCAEHDDECSFIWKVSFNFANW